MNNKFKKLIFILALTLITGALGITGAPAVKADGVAESATKWTDPAMVKVVDSELLSTIIDPRADRHLVGVDGGGIFVNVDIFDLDGVGIAFGKLKGGRKHVLGVDARHEVVVHIAEFDGDLHRPLAVCLAIGVDLLEGVIQEGVALVADGVKPFFGHIYVPQVLGSKHGEDDVHEDHSGNDQCRDACGHASVTEATASQKTTFVQVIPCIYRVGKYSFLPENSIWLPSFGAGGKGQREISPNGGVRKRAR